MCHHIVRRASNVFDPPRFTNVESLSFAPPQRSENERFHTKVFLSKKSEGKENNQKKEFRNLSKTSSSNL